MRQYIGTVLLMVVFLSGCTLTTDSAMNPNEPIVTSDLAVMELPADKVNEAFLSHISQSYHRYGSGPVEITMSYDPGSRNKTAMKAIHELAEMKDILAKKGVKNVQVDTIPLADEEPIVMVAYNATKAHAPKDCAHMPGVTDYQATRFIDEYKFGCSTEMMLAKQIYRPSDLMGVGVTDPMPDGRRATNVVEFTRIFTVDQATEEVEGTDRADIASD